MQSFMAWIQLPSLLSLTLVWHTYEDILSALVSAPWLCAYYIR